MPRAEYTPYSTYKPEGPRAVAERVDINFPHVEFQNSVGKALAQVGEQGYGTLSRSMQHVGDAFDKLGSTFEHVGDQLWQRAEGLQEVQNQTTLTKAEIEYDKYAGEKQVAFNQLQGEAATEDTFRAHVKDLEDKRKEMLDKLPNQSVQNRFDKSTANTVGRYGMQAAEHAATETRKAFILSSEARVDQEKDHISKNGGDIQDTKERANKIHDEIFGKQAPAKGWSMDVAVKAFKDQLTGAYTSQAKVMSRTDPVGAIKLLEANKDFIGQPAYDETMEHVLQNQRVIVSTNIGNEVHEKNPEAPREEKAAEARKKARDISPDPRLEEAAVREVERKDSEHRTNVRQQEERDDQTLEGELYGFGNKDGKIPTKVQDLYVNEETRAAWERIQKNPKKANRILQILAKSAKGDYPDTPQARGRMWELQGMWLNEPGRFRDLDLMQEEIPWSMRTDLRKLQLQVIKEGIKLENDPKTSAAINQMRSAGILPKDLTPLHKDKWNIFSGLVREALIAKGKETGFDKPLSNDEIINLGKTLVDKIPGTGYWPSKLDWGQQSLMDQIKKVPSEHIDAMRSRYPGKTDEELIRNYLQSTIRTEYNERYGKEGKKEKPVEPMVKAKTPPEQPTKPPPEEQQGPPKPEEKRSEMLTRKAAEFRKLMLTEGARKREEEAAAKRQTQ